MGASPKETVKTYFETGDTPSQAEFAELIDSSVGQVVIPIAFTDASGNAVDINGNTVVIPANNLVIARYIVRTTAWDVITTFTAVIDGNTAVSNLQHNLTGAAPDVETVATPIWVTADANIVLTWNQGAAAQGAGFLVVTYAPCTA